jgi:hypothetical protein
MLGRRQINATANSTAQLRSSIAHAAFAVEERLVWGGADILRGIVDVLKWPFERAAWAIERGLIWPLEERTGKWNGSLRAIGLAILALFAVGAGVLGLLWASGSGGDNASQARQAAAPIVTPPPATATEAPPAPKAAAEPALHGAVPDFAPKANAGASSDASAAKASNEAAAASAPTPGEKISSAPGSSAVPAGPAATKVAHQFAGAFVLYEIGQNSAKVREAFAATATPQLAHALLRRPPRLPANAKVPKAKVLNLVPGPRHGDTYTLSVALLRVGVTSELRLNMERDEKTGKWQVTDALG